MNACAIHHHLCMPWVTLSVLQQVVFSVSGDSFLRGSIRRLLAVAVAIVRGLLPRYYFDASVRMDTALDVPALPGYGLYMAESKYAYYEAKCSQHRLDPRRIHSASTVVLDEWADSVHAHIASIHRQCWSEDWVAEFEAHCKRCWIKFEAIHSLRIRSKALLTEEFIQTYHRDPTTTQTQIVDDDLNMPEDRPGVKLNGHHSLPSHVKDAYLKVLYLLRAADASKRWPHNSSGSKS